MAPCPRRLSLPRTLRQDSGHRRRERGWPRAGARTPDSPAVAGRRQTAPRSLRYSPGASGLVFGKSRQRPWERSGVSPLPLAKAGEKRVGAAGGLRYRSAPRGGAGAPANAPAAGLRRSRLPGAERSPRSSPKASGSSPCELLQEALSQQTVGICVVRDGYT